jgi:hypothetical protein
VRALEWAPGEPVAIRVRRRGAWTEMDDEGEAIRRASKPPGWLDVAEAIVARQGMNVNRAGRGFVTYATGSHPEDEIEQRLAGTALAVYHGLLDLDDD